jgi:hypothetical protein
MGRERNHVTAAQGRKLRVVGHIYGELSCGISSRVTNGGAKSVSCNLKGATLQQAKYIRQLGVILCN